MTHSPDHAERARDLLRETPHGNNCAIVGGYAACTCDKPFRAMLAYADERVAAALRGRDAVVEAEDIAAIDAILHRWRLNDDTARSSVKLGLLRRLRAALHDAAHLQQNGEGVGNG